MKNVDMEHDVRTTKKDRQPTRAAVLEAAGRIFAERGYAEATSKEICELAGANSAAVNYYFGGKNRLYEEVLVEAHRQMSSLEELDALVNADCAPEEKLRRLLTSLLHTALTSSELWGVKIFLRELASPSAFVLQNMATVAQPKALRVRTLIQELTGLPADSPKLQWATGFVLIPCISFILFPQALQSLLLPESGNTATPLLDAMFAYVLGGLRALGNDNMGG